MNVITRSLTRILVLFVLSTGPLCFAQNPKFVITAITPSSPTAGQTFSVTVQVQNDSGNPVNVIDDTYFYFENNNGGGDITGGTQNDQIDAGQHEKVVEGVVLPGQGTGITLTVTGYMGDTVDPGTSAPFNVVGPATKLAFVGFPSSGSVDTNVASFAV